jgi:hypothetical protein
MDVISINPGDLLVSTDRNHVHEMIDQLPAAQLAAVAGLLESILDPAARAVASAAPEDESISDEERCAVAEADGWLKQNQPIPFEEVLAEFGVTRDEVMNYRELK